MGAKETNADRARRRADKLLEQLVDEVHDARLTLGKSQAACATEAGIDRAEWTRIERGDRQRVPLGVASRMASAVGLDMVVNYYPADRVVRDIGQLRLLADIRAMLGPDWTWRFEVPVGVPPDRRAWDAVGTHRLTGLVIRVEAQTRLRDIQAILRRIELKRAADAAPRVILAVRSSAINRLALAAAEDVMRSNYPVSSRVAVARLRAGVDPGGDALMLVPWHGANRARHASAAIARP
jgi:hypothetical protein